MNNLIITVAGPGTCISAITNEIEDFLKSKGHKVIVKNEYPSDKREDKFKWYIELRANHMPWGG